MANSLLITGTDTGVGKTVLTAALTAYWQTHVTHQKVAVFKPIQSGIGDLEFYQEHFELEQSAEDITPLKYEHPLAPPVAADLAGGSVDLEKVWKKLRYLQQEFDQIFVEGVGGLGTPITHELTVADIARDWRFPTLLVVPVRLGSIGQTIANIALARASKIDIKGIVLSASSQEALEDSRELTPPEMLEQFTHIPVLGMLPPIQDWNNTEELSQAASQLDLEKIFQI